jgi:hypothetical protein
MKEVYEKLLLQLAQMTPEQKAAEWEALKEFNEIGPEVEDYLRMMECVVVDDSPIVANVISLASLSFSDSDFYLAA